MTIVVAGGTGLAGSAIVRAYQAAGNEVIPVSRKVVDLLDRDATFKFIKDVKQRSVESARTTDIRSNSLAITSASRAI
jgi:GDP-L-fucose synthase